MCDIALRQGINRLVNIHTNSNYNSWANHDSLVTIESAIPTNLGWHNSHAPCSPECKVWDNELFEKIRTINVPLSGTVTLAALSRWDLFHRLSNQSTKLWSIPVHLFSTFTHYFLVAHHKGRVVCSKNTVHERALSIHVVANLGCYLMCWPK